jgi:hypothetical protein
MKKLLVVLLLSACDGPVTAPDAGPFDAGYDAGPIIPDVDALPTIDAENAAQPGDRFQGQQRLWDAYGTERVGDLRPRAFLDLMANDPCSPISRLRLLADPSDDFRSFKRGLEDRRASTRRARCATSRAPGRSAVTAPPNLGCRRPLLVEVDALTAAETPPSHRPRSHELSALGPGAPAPVSTYRPRSADFPTYFSLGQRTR